MFDLFACSLVERRLPCLITAGLLLWFCHLPRPTVADDLLPQRFRYNPKIPSPADHLGFEIGSRHLTHPQLVDYLKTLAAASPRVEIEEYARSHGGRPLVMLTITSPENHQRIDQIRRQHRQLSDPRASAKIDIGQLPAVINMGYSVHGNEPSGSNVAPLVAYFLAASQAPETELMLSEMVVLLDPSLNPDGFQRFASWANATRGQIANPDPRHREHREVWPGGRTNYYWFDLNRDWLPLVHPESQGRARMYHAWKPNVLLDFHEMGTDATYFFQPGVPARQNPLIPAATLDLTSQFAKLHARELDKIGSLYFTEERYDDFYPGKGSTYPDLHGGIGILFEQASSRGQVQESDNGRLEFPFTIRNHFTTSLSSLQATWELRRELHEHLRGFYQESLQLGQAQTSSGFVFSARGDPARLDAFMQTLTRHDVEVYRLAMAREVGGVRFDPAESCVVPTAQAEFRFLQALTDERVTFQENIFYDVSAWSLPLAFNLSSAELGDLDLKPLLGARYELPTEQPPQADVDLPPDALGYLVDWRGYYAPRSLYRLVAEDIRVKVAQQPFQVDVNGRRETLGHGTILIPAAAQPEKRERIVSLLRQAVAADQVRVLPLETGLTPQGIDLGSSDFATLEKPRVLLVVGEGVKAYEAGEVWHLLDRRYEMPATLVETYRLGGLDWDEYNVAVFVSGDYQHVTNAAIQKLKRWLADGGTLAAIGTAGKWVADQELAKIRYQSPPSSREERPRRPYGEAQDDAALTRVAGAILRTDFDPTHPLAYGYLPDRGDTTLLPVFRSHNLMVQRSASPYNTPVAYPEQVSPVAGGYVSDENAQRLRGTASVLVAGSGRGRVVLFNDNPNFRGHWYGTNRLMANALFFGPLIRTPE